MEESFLIDIQYDSKEAKDIPFAGQDPYYVVRAATKKLNIKLPGETDPWYEKDNYLYLNPYTTSPALTKVQKGTKEWSGIWIEKSQAGKPWMFQDIEVFIEKQENSQVFCKSYPKPACGAGANIGIYRLKHTSGDSDVPNVWGEMSNKLIINSNKDQNLEKFVNKQGPVSPVLQLAYSSHGEWVDANKFCKSERESEINDADLKQLELYCSKPKD